ncbi:MAG TPA: ABC-F family ATP-binding cassette domain-containing protein [Anaerolineaceae bacterium]|nr:ABC-F family ATP-binding cassette domain-containing protein [Anaerolineaceae bacterium]
MAILTANRLSKSFGAEDLFSDLALSIPHRARIGLVGPNGVGKTTLLRILVGLDEPSEGTVQRARGLQIGYLPQGGGLDSDKTLWEECLAVFAGLVERQRELTRLEKLMADPDRAESALETYGRLQDAFDRLGGYTFEQQIRQTLTGLGFSRADENRPIRQLSGGQRTRALLARLLLTNPDLLLLDEPTNHLDIAAVEWLEAYLRDWGGAVLIVSHDRYFLDQVADTIWEMTPALEVYRGNYSAYLAQRADRYARQLEEYRTQQEFIEKEEEYIRRNMAGQNTRQAKGRLKRLERLLEEARLTPPPTARSLHLRLEPTGRSGDQVLVTRDLAVGYADEGRPLFEVPDLVLRRGECAAIIGPNGAGKTTFLKHLLEQVPPYAGEVKLGASLQIGYFAQAHEGLRPERTLMDEIQAVAPKMLPAEVRDYLARFLFTGDDAFKTVAVLSGGERGRLALACLALQGANLLLLDEPTNHLDLPSQEVLQAILADFGGTILLVSHDRYLIDALATQVWEVLPDERRLVVFAGAYSEYRAWRAAAAAAEIAHPVRPVETKPNGPAKPAREGLSKNEQWRRQKRLGELEEAITELEARLAAVTRQLETPPDDPAQVTRLAHEYERLQADLDQRLHEWAEAAEE